MALESEIKVGDIVTSQQQGYKIERELGQGICGPVYLAKEIVSPFRQFALKRISKLTKQSEERFLNYLKSLGVKGIIYLESVIYDSNGDPQMLVLEYCQGGDLFSNISSSQSLFFYEDEASLPLPIVEIRLAQHNKKVRKVFLEILEAVQGCHRAGVFHRDLKPENILFTQQGHIKLGDFGLATTDLQSYEFGCGSVFYMPPEVLFFHKSQPAYNPKFGDIWSLGVLFINLVTGKNPWESANHSSINFSHYLLDPTVLLDLFPLSSQGYELAQSMLSLNPQLRPSLDEIISKVESCTEFIVPRSLHSKSSTSYSSPDSISLHSPLSTASDYSQSDSNYSSSLNQDPWLYLYSLS